MPNVGVRRGHAKVAGTLGVLQRELRAVHGTVSVHASLGGVPMEEDREAQEQAKKLRKESRCMISPEGNFRATWDMLQVFLLVYLAYMVPLRVGYDLHVVTFGRLWWVDALVDAYFIVDVGLNFRTGYLLEQDHETPVIIMAWRKVGVRYMKGWLLIDVVASFPLEFIRLMVRTAARDLHCPLASISPEKYRWHPAPTAGAAARRMASGRHGKPRRLPVPVGAC